MIDGEIVEIWEKCNEEAKKAKFRVVLEYHNGVKKFTLYPTDNTVYMTDVYHDRFLSVRDVWVYLHAWNKSRWHLDMETKSKKRQKQEAEELSNGPK